MLIAQQGQINPTLAAAGPSARVRSLLAGLRLQWFGRTVIQFKKGKCKHSFSLTSSRLLMPRRKLVYHQMKRQTFSGQHEIFAATPCQRFPANTECFLLVDGSLTRSDIDFASSLLYFCATTDLIRSFIHLNLPYVSLSVAIHS